MLEIKSGNPSDADAPASYNRFVLPFAYNLEKITSKEKQNQYYVAENDPDKIWRERYLTEETADVLFQRTKWFALQSDNKDLKFDIPKTDGTGFLTVCMNPPRLVLFEWPKNIENRKKEEEKNTDLLHTGFLIIELYFDKSDGNCPTLDDMLKLNEMEFDKQVKGNRFSMLADLLDKMKGNKDWMNGGEYRIETLLWGGDELMWVVPAWKGWETLQFFYEQSGTWEFTNTKGGKAPLKHAGGLVFCHHNAPIYRIKDLARRLSEAAKKDKSGNLFAYQVLESFDHISNDFDKIRKSQAIGGDANTLILDGKDIENISNNIKALKDNEFPKNKLHEITKRLRNGGDAKDLIEKAIKGLLVATQTALDKLKGDCNGDNPKWGHIADLWDYIV
ncbi:MAG: hypothetical protein HZB80_07835 [Deltaproteobacteria bacterium]|nr:hypothetical protein [Deltaproteobacteria bacterium]